MIKVCHISSAHNTYDTRILLKECCSLAKNGYDVSLVISATKDEAYKGVKIRAIKKYENRFKRMTLTVFSALRKALSTKSKIYHLHDPELFFVGIFLKMLGKKVVFDVHENISAQIKTKDWLPFNKVFSHVFRFIDFLNAKMFYLVLAEDSYVNLYERFKPKSVVLLNLPDVEAFEKYRTPDRSHVENAFFYVGDVTFARGIDKTLEALCILKKQNVNFTFHCIGPMEQSIFERVSGLDAYLIVKENVKFYGIMKLDEAYEISKKCLFGLSLLKPIENYKYSYSTKIFEYMSVNLPIITSDFELYKNVVEKYECGFCVDTTNENEIAAKMLELVNNRELVNYFGKNGFIAVQNNFNWKNEERKLLDFYDQIIKK